MKPILCRFGVHKYGYRITSKIDRFPRLTLFCKRCGKEIE